MYPKLLPSVLTATGRSWPGAASAEEARAPMAVAAIAAANLAKRRRTFARIPAPLFGTNSVSSYPLGPAPALGNAARRYGMVRTPSNQRPRFSDPVARKRHYLTGSAAFAKGAPKVTFFRRGQPSPPRPLPALAALAGRTAT